MYNNKSYPEIIHSNQRGFVKGRFIGEAARSIIDIMDYTKSQNIPGIILFIDFEKAFDSLDWDFMIKSLDAFGFGPSLKRWVETFYKNISSCVINNGICISYFEVQRLESDRVTRCHLTYLLSRRNFWQLLFEVGQMSKD